VGGDASAKSAEATEETRKGGKGVAKWEVRRDLTCRNGRSAAQLQDENLRKSEGVLESLSTGALVALARQLR
jgi:hypothetical protein